jgi:hypothetical protein
MRIEYEPYGADTSISCLNADLNPVNQSQNQGFICITHDTPEVANIDLIIDKAVVSGTDPVEYGPIYAGSDFAVLRAETTSIDDVPVPKVDVTFELSPYLGAINGSDTSSSLSNSAGFAFSSYQPPTNANSLGYYSFTVLPSSNTTYPSPAYKEIIIHDEDASLTGKEEQIFIYQIRSFSLIIMNQRLI